MAFSRTMSCIVQGVETLIVAPPGYGKRTFILRNRHREPFNDFFDTDSVIRSNPNHWYGIITEYACLIPKANLSFIFLPSKDLFLAGCLAAEIENPEQMYSDYLQFAKSATYVITSGDSMLFYQRFIDKAISHFFDGEPLIPVPTFKQGYRPEPAYSDVSISSLPSLQATANPAPSYCAGCSNSAMDSSTSATSSLDLEIENRNLPHSSPSTVLDVCKEYTTSPGRNIDLEAADHCPDEHHLYVAQLFTKAFNVLVVPTTIKFPSSKGAVFLEYFGGNFVKIGPIYMSLRVLCKKRFDNGTVQFSPPDWLVP